MNIVIKGLLVILWLLAVPGAAGGIVLFENEKKSPGMCLLAGYLFDVLSSRIDDFTYDMGNHSSFIF